MRVDLKPEDLIAFENCVTALFSEKKIKAPVHLDNGNENQLIWIFKHLVSEDDWVLCSWRSHYRSLLKGVPQEEMLTSIKEGKSISLCFPEHKVISSAIVGGILPVAVGIAMAIKKKGGKNKAVCFMGEMTSETGAAHECIKYSENHDLPILFVLEDNGKSVCTPTLPVWGLKKLTYGPVFVKDYTDDTCEVYSTSSEKVVYYKYESIYPHAGGLQRINF